MDLTILEGYVPAFVLAQIPDIVDNFEINTPLRLSHFLAQCSHESGGFKTTVENLNYSSDGLKKIFSKYFPDDLADEYARQPVKIGSRVYADRLGNGDEDSQDGYTYRGRGYIQITGKDNYQYFGDSIEDDLVSYPDLVATKYPLMSAAWFFKSRKINNICDLGDSDDVVIRVTKKVNGGTIGLDDRLKQFHKFRDLLV
jgi:putative chitinase